MTHPHHEAKSGNLDRRLWASAALNLCITLAELAGGLWAGSLALLADANGCGREELLGDWK